MNNIPHQDLNSFMCEYKLQHEILAENILSVVPCEKIFLLAATVTCYHIHGLFKIHTLNSQSLSHYHVLVVVQRDGKAPNMEVQDKIEGKLLHFIPTTAIVLDTEQFEYWQKQQHPFAMRVVNTANLLYGQKETLKHKVEVANAKDQQIKIESMFAQGRNKAQEFLAGADLFRIREQNKMVAFMLHQSLEQILRSLLLILTGLEITTHNLDKLLRFCSMFYYRFSEIFKSNDGKSENLLQLLQRAYINARYKNDYHISTVDLISLQEKIKTIHNICERIVKKS